MYTEPMIAVRDVPASVAWYKAILGCSNDHDRAEFDRLLYNGDVLLMLHQLKADEHGLSPPVVGAVGSGVLIWVFVDDLERVFLRAKKQGAEIVVQPHDNSVAGWREFTFRDPDGYHIAIAE